MFEVKRLLCPVDLTELSIRPVVYAGAIANWYRARLTALHVVPTFEPMEGTCGCAVRSRSVRVSDVAAAGPRAAA